MIVHVLKVDLWQNLLCDDQLANDSELVKTGSMFSSLDDKSLDTLQILSVGLDTALA